MLIYVFLNVLVLFNVVIAMMADTYALMTSQRRGLYNYNIIKSVSIYKLDKRYGALILLIMPLNVIAFLLLPFYILIKDKKRLVAFNRRVYSILYACFAIVLTAIYLALNLTIMPFAYLKTCAHKINLLRKKLISC